MSLIEALQQGWAVAVCGLCRQGERGGQIVNPTAGSRRREVTSFRGDHIVESYVIKDGVVVARGSLQVPIDPE